MHTIRVRNVAEALPAGLKYLLWEGRREESRAGPVIVAGCPVTTVYERPTERVVFSAVRDANPFFHLAEALWMLAGRNDAAFPNRFVRDFGERFAEPDGTVHGAYGFRWRYHFGYDQIHTVVQTLRNDPSSRQCVLSMWDASVRTADGGEAEDLRGKWRDRPCNTQVYLRIRGDRGMVDHGSGDVRDYDNRVLDITVLCRSNDIIWGAYGSNAVHFSILQEYLAAKIGVGVGLYYQVSNNYHAYVAEIERLQARAAPGELVQCLHDNCYGVDPGDMVLIEPQRLVREPTTFDLELQHLLSMVDDNKFRRDKVVNWHNEFLRDTAYWMLLSYKHWREKLDPLRMAVREIAASDWRVVCEDWFQRRQAPARAKEGV